MTLNPNLDQAPDDEQILVVYRVKPFGVFAYSGNGDICKHLADRVGWEKPCWILLREIFKDE